MKDKHITVNLDEWQYSIIEEIANQEERTVTNTTYMIIKKYIDDYATRKGYINK